MLRILNTVMFLLMVNSLFAQPYWQNIKSVYNTRVITSDIHGKLYISTAEKVYTSTDSGVTWDSLSFSEPFVNDFFSIIITPDSGHIFVVAEPGVYRSKDEGETWDHLDRRIDGTYSIGIDSTGQLFASGSGAVFRSANNGESWDSVFHVLGIFTNGILCTPSNQVYVASIIGGLFRSDDGGETWDSVKSFPVDTGYFTAMAYNPITGTILVAYQHNSFYTGAQGRIYRSDDNGNSWNSVFFESYVIDALYTDADGTCYAGAIIPYQSVDDGISWQSFDTGMAGDLQIQCFGKVNNTLYAGDRGFGLYRLSEHATSVSEKIKSLNSITVYNTFPNPARNTVTIPFYLSRTEHVTLRICNSEGQEIECLIDGQLLPGKHNAEWNASGNQNGVYFFHFQAGSVSESGKIIINH